MQSRCSKSGIQHPLSWIALKIRYTINLYYKQLIGHDTHPVANTTVSIPVFKSWKSSEMITYVKMKPGEARALNQDMEL